MQRAKDLEGKRLSSGRGVEIRGRQRERQGATPKAEHKARASNLRRQKERTKNSETVRRASRG